MFRWKRWAVFQPTGLFFVRQRNFEKQLENLENDLKEYWDESKNKEEDHRWTKLCDLNEQQQKIRLE